MTYKQQINKILEYLEKSHFLTKLYYEQVKEVKA